MMSELKLGIAGITFADLLSGAGLATLDREFLTRLQAQAPASYADLCVYRGGNGFTPAQISVLLLACAPVLEDVLGDLFGIASDLERARFQALAHDPIFAFKKQFVQKRARRRVLAQEEMESFASLDAWLGTTLAQAKRDPKIIGVDRELAVAQLAGEYLLNPEENAENVERLTRWCIRALSTSDGRAAVYGWVSFHLPQPLDYKRLIPVKVVADGRLEGEDPYLRARDGFALTDQRMSSRQAQDQVHYCIYCHDHDGDFCSKGFPQKKGDPTQGLKTNPLGSMLTGCPLDEKISEMNLLKRDGYTLAALAMAMVDNPMVPATGHRICNDCMKSCIYQKQDPVNVPEIETRVLIDALELPWGVEIYDLLTRWNPLRSRQWLSRPYNGLKILIAGMGPAGFTLAHHLLMEGFAVVGIDGLKIEPLPQELLRQPIQHYSELEESLDTRIMAGFGGVAEYGITVRWDKNFLKLIYLTLARRPYFQVFGGVRLGGTLTLDDAWNLGFDHIAIATGAGLPKALPIGNSLARGMRQAVDFLMALQLTGAAKATSLTNLQVRLPAVVVGGGLTAIDTATEVQAYYIAQVEKTLKRYERLTQTFGEARVREHFDEESLGILNEFVTHGKAVRLERKRAAIAGASPNFEGLIRAWGGVTVVYRRAMNESPAYLRNHEEIAKAMEEGIYYRDALEPIRADLDRFNHVMALVCRRQQQDAAGLWGANEEEITLPARSIFIAAGATPNTIYDREYPGTFAMQGIHFQLNNAVAGKLTPVAVAQHCKLQDFGPFTSYNKDQHRVTFIGDTHPVFHGSVVKAIASALRTYPQIVAALAVKPEQNGDLSAYRAFHGHIERLLQPRVVLVRRHSPTVVEVRVHAPMAAKNFRPGQFFRLQNFERQALILEETRLQTEALALTGASVDEESGCISLMVLEVGASSRLCATLQEGDPIILMGPTGTPTEIPENKTVMVIGGRRAAAVMRTVGPALRARDNRVLYIAGFQTADEVYCKKDLEDAADIIVWCTAAGESIVPGRPQDRALTGDFMEILTAYAGGALGASVEVAIKSPQIPLQTVDRILVIGTNRLLRMVQEARAGVLRPYLTKSVEVVASINSPMQCMLKGVCSQCLQWHVDLDTGKRTRAVFSCFCQDQPLGVIDLDNLDARLGQNRAQERLTSLWLDYLFAHHTFKRA